MNIIDESTAHRRSETLKALGHPIRLRIIDLLNQGEKSVGQIADVLDLKSAIISQQLKILRLSDLVVVDKRDGHSFYSIANPHLPQLFDCLRSCDTA